MLPFPAVTMNAAMLDHPYRLVESLYNNVKYDCSLFANEDKDNCDTDCLEGTEQIRGDLMEPLHSVLMDQFYTYEQECRYEVDSSPNWHEGLEEQLDDLSDDACSSRKWGNGGSKAMRMLHPCLLNMPDRENGREFHESLSSLMELMAETFRMPDCIWPEATSRFEDVCQASYDDEYWNCRGAVWDLPDNVVCPAVALFKIVVSPEKEMFRPGVVLHSERDRYNELLEKAVDLLGNLTKAENEDIPLICLFEELNEAKNRSSECPEHIEMDYLLAHMDLVYKMYKFAIAPTSMVSNEKSELADAEEMKEVMKSQYRYNISDGDVLNDAATMLACKYGAEKISTKCELFSTVLTSSGVGYTFNNVPYWELFKNTTSSLDFYKEIYEKPLVDFEKSLPRQIDITGKEYSLDFIIRHDSYNYDPVALLGAYKPHEEVLFSLHDPANVPDLNSEGIVIEPQMLYEIMVYPTVTVTDESALALDPEKRNCHTREENDKLRLFNIYSQSACMFECKLKLAIMECNCSAWDYPRFDPEANLCLGSEANLCFHNVLEAETLNNECGCLNDCEYVNYEVDIHVTTLQHTNSGEDLE